MPIIKQAKKRVKQAQKRQVRNYNVRTAVRKAIRVVSDFVKAGDKSGAEGALPAAYKTIDTAAKKNVMPKNTANRRKAMLAKMIAGTKTKSKTTKTAKAPKAKAKAAKK